MRFAAGKVALDRRIRGAGGEPRRRCVKRRELPVTVGQDEDLAPGQLPEYRGGVLDGRRILRRHDRLQGRKRGQQRRRPFQHRLTLLLKALERHHRIAQRLRDPLADVNAHPVLYDHQHG